MKRNFNTPFTSGEVGRVSSYDPLAFLWFPFKRKRTRRPDVYWDLDCDNAILNILDAPLKGLVSDRGRLSEGYLLSPFRGGTRRANGDLIIFSEGQNLRLFGGPPLEDMIDTVRKRHVVQKACRTRR